MTRQHSRWGMTVALVCAFTSIAACDRGTAPSGTTSAPAATGGTNPNASVTPQPADVQASGRTGPADASTAIGGVTANQGTNNAGSGGKPAPTAGDGAASAASK